MDIKEDKHFQDFLDSKHYKPKSEESILRRLTLYCQHTHKTPTQLIEEAEIEEDQRIRMKNRIIKKQLKNFLDHLYNGNYSFNYIKSIMGTVRGFYREYDVELPKQIIRVHNQSQKFTTDDIIQHEHIKKALEIADTKWKAIILTMASSGMGSGELRSLTIDDLKKGLSDIGVKQSSSIGEIKELVEENPDHIITWKIARIKTGYPYFCFSSPETLSFIVKYLSDKYVPGQEYLFGNRSGKRLLPGVMTYNFGKINDQAGFGYVDGKRFFHSHGLRSFFASTLYRAGLPQLTIDFFLAHKINPVTEAYFKADIGALKQEYVKVLPELSFIEPVETRVITDDLLRGFEEREQAREREMLEMRRLIDDIRRDRELP